LNIASVSWADHLTFGEGDGRLDTPAALERRLCAWREELGVGALHWRVLRARIAGRFHAAPGYEHPSQTAARGLAWNDLAIVPALAHSHGIRAWLYVSLFDEGWPLAPESGRAASHHNAMHGQHVSWQSELTRSHPEWLTVDRTRAVRQQGVVSLAYPRARQAFIDRWLALLDGTDFDGLFICLRSQSRPADHADQFGFNEPALEDFASRHGVSDLDRTSNFPLPTSRSTFDLPTSHLQKWRDHLGDYLTALLTELKAALPRRTALAAGCARGDVIGPPLGNATLHWREWVNRGLIDQLVIDQSSSQCPSMWHQLWPMHRGTGYAQNYLEPQTLPPLVDHLRDTYAPLVAGTATQLLVARQWHGRDRHAERELLDIAGVAGLVFSTFRHDNPGPIARGDWRAGHRGV
jgi:hypothetical protein